MRCPALQPPAWLINSATTVMSTDNCHAAPSCPLVVLVRHAQKLYSLGARRFLVLNVVPGGCLPQSMGLMGLTDRCSAAFNAITLRHNQLLFRKMKWFLRLRPQVVAVYADHYKIVKNVIQHPETFGEASNDDESTAEYSFSPSTLHWHT